LKQAAIHEQSVIALLDEILRSGDRTSAAEEAEIQAHGLPFAS
jgi:hypothetical protein